MEDRIHLQVVAPSGAVYDGFVSCVQLPLDGGSVGILPRHAPLLGTVVEGVVKCTQGGEEHFIAVTQGVAHVENNEVTVLVGAAERAEDIDPARAVSAEHRARERLKSPDPDVDVFRAVAALHRALARQTAVRMMKK